jgi:Chromo (CHRromatin Organisation MOdifier) domain
MASVGVRLNISTTGHPQTDGATERANRTVEQMLRCFANARQSNWYDLLPMVEYAYNSAVHEATGVSPFSVVYGYEPKAPIDLALGDVPAASRGVVDRGAFVESVRRMIVDAQNKQQKYANAHRRDVQFAVGDLVLLSTANLSWPEELSRKLLPKFLGPFTVAEKLGPVNYKLQLPYTMKHVHPVFHVSLLKKWVPSDSATFPGRRDPEYEPPAVIPAQNVFKVDSIIDGPWYRGGGKLAWYKCRWLGWSPARDQWVREDNILDPDLISEFLSRPRPEPRH